MATAHRSSRAETDLIEIWGHIAKDDPLAADRQLDRIDAACEMLAGNPQGGPRREDLARGLRFYPVGNYLIFYTASEDGITVARVLHGARDYSREFQ
ncbi:MAG: type II toxin-antitoxin system RelE/ParE family toxin [Chthoniobacteraceae bacterium]